MEKRPRKYKEIRDSIAKGIDPRYPHGPNSTVCAKCGEKYLPLGSKFCLSCGSRLVSQPGRLLSFTALARH